MIASSLRLQAGLPENTLECTGRQIVTWMPGNRDSPMFGWMFELAMTSTRIHEEPAVFVQESQQVAHLHASMLAAAEVCGATLICRLHFILDV